MNDFTTPDNICICKDSDGCYYWQRCYRDEFDVKSKQIRATYIAFLEEVMKQIENDINYEEMGIADLDERAGELNESKQVRLKYLALVQEVLSNLECDIADRVYEGHEHDEITHALNDWDGLVRDLRESINSEEPPDEDEKIDILACQISESGERLANLEKQKKVIAESIKSLKSLDSKHNSTPGYPGVEENQPLTENFKNQ
jgi:hypothetical protein